MTKIQLNLQMKSNCATARKIINMNIYKLKAKVLKQWKLK